MKADTQHLDFLISQYVDGSLDAASRKQVEQQLLVDPAARELYKDHRDVQDLLDDWGNRIPMIHWDDFDKKLAGRLEKEVVGGEVQMGWRRWIKPLAAAAALFMAAMIGYAWHSVSDKGGGTPAMATGVPTTVQPSAAVVILDSPAVQASRVRVNVEEAGAMPATRTVFDPHAVAISPPSDAAAWESLKEGINYGGGTVRVQPNNAFAVGAGEPPKNEKDKTTGFDVPVIGRRIIGMKW